LWCLFLLVCFVWVCLGCVGCVCGVCVCVCGVCVCVTSVSVFKYFWTYQTQQNLTNSKRSAGHMIKSYAECVFGRTALWGWWWYRNWVYRVYNDKRMPVTVCTGPPLRFQARSKNCEDRLLASSCLSAWSRAAYNKPVELRVGRPNGLGYFVYLKLNFKK